MPGTVNGEVVNEKVIGSNVTVPKSSVEDEVDDRDVRVSAPNSTSGPQLSPAGLCVREVPLRREFGSPNCVAGCDAHSRSGPETWQYDGFE